MNQTPHFVIPKSFRDNSPPQPAILKHVQDDAFESRLNE
jgi:hypothetical protein